MTCRTSITTPPSRAVVSLTPSLRTMITTPSNSTIDTLTVNVQLVSTQLRWTPFTGKVNTTKKEQPHHFVVLTPPTAVIKEPHLPRLLPALSKLMSFSCLHVSVNTARRVHTADTGLHSLHGSYGSHSSQPQGSYSSYSSHS